ncbi:MAG: HD domain-containing phosphohydrolase [bacterium]
MENTKTLLFVDDEPNILSALKRVFLDDDFEVLTANSGKEALGFLKSKEIQLIISDQRMPEMSGTELLAKVRETKPEIMRIILSGFADMDAAVDAINNGQIYQFIFKPWNDEELRSVVLRALETHDLQKENKRLLVELKELNSQLAQKVKERTALIVQKNLELGKLNKSLESSLVSTVRVFVNLIDLSRPEVSRHARRVATLATAFAKQMDWEEKQIHDIEIAALLHDIGKIGIPVTILRKPKEDLLDGELKALNNHPIIGQNTLGAIDAFNYVGKIIRAHHERWDGKGFPDELSGEDIPIEARLLAVCNHYDHLEEEGRTRAFIEKFFRNNAGEAFDPNIVKYMLDFVGNVSGLDDSEDDGGGGRSRAEETSQRKVKVLPNELKPGMVLADNLLTGKGIFLLPQGQLLKETHIRSIHDIQRVDPIKGSIEVFVE